MQKLSKDKQKNTRAHNAPVPDAPVTRESSAFTPTLEQKQLVNRYKVTGEELSKVLRAHGSTQAEFAKFIACHQTTVNRYCLQGKRVIKWKYAQKLEEFVGTELYMTTIAASRNVGKNMTDLSTKSKKDNDEKSV